MRVRAWDKEESGAKTSPIWRMRMELLYTCIYTQVLFEGGYYFTNPVSRPLYDRL